MAVGFKKVKCVCGYRSPADAVRCINCRRSLKGVRRNDKE